MDSIGGQRLKLMPTLCTGLLILLLGACVSSTERFVHQYQSRPAKVEAILAAMQPELEQSFREGPPYSMTELQGLHAANQLGPEGQDASRLWEQEITARYQFNRSKTTQALRREVSGYEDALMDDILALRVPHARNRRWRGTARTQLLKWPFSTTATAKAAHVQAVCQSLASTPVQWANLYPDRAPFTFERFNINSRLIQRWCDN